MSVNFNYMFDEPQTTELKNLYYSMENTSERPIIKTIINGIILPLKSSKNKNWGIGGVIDSNGFFVDESKVETAFGGPYDFDEKEVEVIHLKVFYLPVIPNHWGHFLINSLCRLWCLDSIKDYKIVYCGYNWPDNEISNDILDALRFAGVSSDRLIPILHPTRFDEIIVAQETAGYSVKFNNEYKKICSNIVENVNSSKEIAKLTQYSKIYFTRRQYLKSKFNEFGEKQFENFYQKNGYKVLSPDHLSFAEEVFYFSHADKIACMSGTVCLNCAFMREGSEITVFNRTSTINPPQMRAFKLFKINAIYVDVFCNFVKKHPIVYGSGPFWIRMNSNFTLFIKENNSFFERRNKCLSFFSDIYDFFAFHITRIIFIPLYCLFKKVKKLLVIRNKRTDKNSV